MWTLHLLAGKDGRTSPRSGSIASPGPRSSPRCDPRSTSRSSTPVTPTPTKRERSTAHAGQTTADIVDIKAESGDIKSESTPVKHDQDEPISPRKEIGIKNERETSYRTLADVEVLKEEEGTKLKMNPWGFAEDEISRWPVLARRNFWCIQRHSATALHYDLRMQLDGATVSWAVPKGLLGITKDAESSRLAVETALHPISYTTFEGSDGRLLWDIGTYAITRPYGAEDSDSESDSERSRRKRRRRAYGPNMEEVDDGRYQEDQFRLALHRPMGYGKSRSIHFTLKDGAKMTNHSYILILSGSNPKMSSMTSTGQLKKTWFIRLPRGIDGYPWDKGGEDGPVYGPSVKTGRTFEQVCSGPPGNDFGLWEEELKRFSKWKGDPGNGT